MDCIHRRLLCLGGLSRLAGMVIVGQPLKASAQTRVPRVARVGWLGWAGDTTPDAQLPLTALRAGLAERGWREGDNLTLLLQRGEREQAPALAAELVNAGVEVIVAQGVMVFPARVTSGRTPIVFGINGDPVEAGIAASWAQPAGTATGVSALAPELAGKRLELLQAAVPGLKRVAILANERHPGLSKESAAARAAAQTLGLQLLFHPVRTPADMPGALAAIAAAKAASGANDPLGLFAFPDTLINREAGTVADFARRERLPSISGWGEFAHAGNLMSYGPDHSDFYRLMASYVDRLLKGAKPGELPIEQPTRFRLTLNLQTARELRLALPASFRARADEVIG